LNPTECVTATEQGSLGLQIREDDAEMKEIMAHLNHVDVAKKIGVERKILNLMEGGCQLPLGVYCPNEKQVFVSFDPARNLASKNFYFEPEQLDGFAEKVVAILNEVG